jgi:hypothetical protein
MASRKEQKERARRERLAAQQAAEAQAAKRRRLQLGGGAIVLTIVAAVVVVAVVSSGGKSGGSDAGPPARLSTTSTANLGKLQPVVSEGPLGAEGIPVPKGPALAPAASTATGQSVDGIHCNAGEQLIFHIHAHIAVFVNGTPRQVPADVGIPPGAGCLYWLHTHAPDGIMHIESPEHRTFTLGNFFDIWRQPLGPDQVGPARGHITAFYNGALYRGDPRNIPLNHYAQIQLDVGTPLIAPEKIGFAGTGL